MRSSKTCPARPSQYISEEILTPLGLPETSWPDDANMPEPYANGKFDSSNRPNKVWTVMNPDWGPAGALGVYDR